MPDMKEQALKNITRSRYDCLVAERQLHTLRLTHRDNMDYAFKLGCEEQQVHEASNQGAENFLGDYGQ